jgi:hypothetical protein
LAHDCNSSTRVADVEGPQVPDQPGLHSKTMSQ